VLLYLAINIHCLKGLEPHLIHPVPQNVDNNNCSEGTLIGGLLGAGLATAGSRGKDQWWAIPAGGAAGAMLGCQIDGG